VYLYRTEGLNEATLFLYEHYYNLEGASFHLIAQKVIVADADTI
jgi:hypothetical protein